MKPQTLAAWRCQGKYDLPFTRIGRRIVYLDSVLQDVLKNGLKPKGPDPTSKR